MSKASNNEFQKNTIYNSLSNILMKFRTLTSFSVAYIIGHILTRYFGIEYYIAAKNSVAKI